MIKLVVDWLRSELLADSLAAYSIYKLQRKQIDDLENREVEELDPRGDVDLCIIEEYDREIKQLMSAVEDKVKSNLLGISVAFSIIFAGMGVLTGEPSRTMFAGFCGFLCRLLLAIGVVYLLCSGLLAIKVLGLRKVYLLSPEGALELKSMRHRKCLLLANIDLNRKIHEMLTAFLEVSNRCIRNGILCMGILVLTMVVVTSRSAIKSTGIIPGLTSVVVNGQLGRVVRYREISHASEWTIRLPGEKNPRVFDSPPAKVELLR